MTKGYNVRELEMLQDDVGAWFYQFEGKPYTGYAYALFPHTNKLSFEYNLVEGYQEGIQRQWYQNGQLKTQHVMRGNIYHGLAKSWYESGVPRYEAEYDMGKEIWSKSYNENGELIKEYPS
jgi:antitoxin component YwqK of YwqJK toxin-antitoxin module